MNLVSNAPISGKALLLAALRHQKLPAVPWVPFAGVHAGRLKGYTAREVLTDGDKLFASLLEVNRVYDPDGQPVIFDLQVEAEIYGCELLWAEDAPPSVASHPLTGRMEVPARLPERSDGRLPLILDVMERMQAAVGAHTALYGLVTGPFTLASHLRGIDIFLDTADHPDFLAALLDFARAVSIRVAEFYLEAGMDVIAVVDPLISQISPRHFKRFFARPFTEVFAAIRTLGAYSSFFVCGDATKNIEPMCVTAPDSISVDENIDLPAVKAITDRYNITIGGNIPLTTVMLLGTQQDNMKLVLELLDQVEPHNYILAPGCDMPYDVPIENVVGVVQAVRNPEETREMLAHYQAAELDVAVELPDYGQLEKPLIEVYTLDSATCAACGYMLGAAQRAAAELGDAVDLVEYKFTTRENVARVKKLGVKNLPSIYINGELKYSSIIPGNRELLEEIKRLL